ncbi:hypothetical protein OJJOAM_004724 [Cupriavidus sp. H18C1]|uniref:hypothetical protein n=1 Tax=Cupriavidus sp. H18C1 TaxID=3241601 RepID=UPI003BB86016
MPHKSYLRAAVFGLLWAALCYWLANSFEALRILVAIIVFFVLCNDKVGVTRDAVVLITEAQADVNSELEERIRSLQSDLKDLQDELKQVRVQLAEHADE